MSVSLRYPSKILIIALACFLVSTLAFAQGGTTTSLSGRVADTSGAIIPGADVTIKSNATGAVLTTVTGADGAFVMPGLAPGMYTVTVSLMGFKTAVLPDVQVLAATPSSVAVKLEVGQLEETIVVTGATELVQTQSATVSTTIAVRQIQQLPVITHTALDYVISLPGIETPGSATRSSTVNGLPRAAVNITLDGINVQDKRTNTEGFFMFIRPMMDSVEEITVSTSNPGAEASGSGSANIRMETRAGSNRFSASLYNTWRNQAGLAASDVITRKNKRGFLWRLNTAYWFNKRDLAKTATGDYFINDLRLQTPGFRMGGPVLRDRLFYFFNYEEFRLPESRSRTRYILNQAAQAGNFTYPAVDGSGNRTINLLELASRNGQTPTADPSIAKLLADIRAATGTAGSVRSYNLNADQYDFLPSATQLRKFPTLRLDYNLTNAHRLTFTYRYNAFDSTPDFLNSAEARYPGFPNSGAQVSDRYMWQGTVRSTLGKSLMNEVRLGRQDTLGRGNYFGKGVNEGMFNCADAGCQSAGGKGWNFNFVNVGVDLTSATAYGSSSAGVAGQWSVEDTLTWLKGTHTISAGAAWTRINMRNWSMTPYYATLTFGTSSNDAGAYGMLDKTSGNFPGGINDTYVGYARNLYGFLTGRVTQLAGTAYLGTDGAYKFNGERTNQTTADDWGFFASDSWRVKPNLTVNAGVRYQVQMPMTTDGQYSRPQTWQMVYGITGAGSGRYGSGNLYKPGTIAGTTPQLVKYENGSPAYNTDWNNFAPSVGATWRPNLGNGLLSKILGTDPVFRGGYSLSYQKLGTGFFDSNYSNNPGRSRAATRNATAGTPVLGYDGWPVLLRDTARLYPSAFPTSVQYPLTPAVNETLDIHYPDWPVTSTHQYSIGWQRELGKSMALDVRYVGNTNVGGWTTWNMTNAAQWSMLSNENGFLDEYMKARNNLRANIVAGLGNTFAYTGAQGTSPLPIFLAYFAGIPLNDSRNQNPASYTHANFANSAWYNNLAMYQNSGATNSQLTGITGTGSSGLQNGLGLGTGLDVNRAAAGLPANFFMANPAVAQGNAYLETTAGNTRYNGLQIELRRRMSHGLLVQANYQYAFGRKGWSQRSLREDWHYVDTTAGPAHQFKVNWVYELPFGRGRAFGSGVSRLLDAFIGGWEVDGIARVQSGSKFNYGGYRLVGMTEAEFRDMFKFYRVKDSNNVERIYMLPQDVIEQSIIALYTTSATTASGYAGVTPTGKYLAPATGPDCVQYFAGMCSGTKETRIVTGPKYWKVDLSFVKQIPLFKRLRAEARMDLFNVFDTINFNANAPTGTGNTNGMGSSLSNWQVTSAATDTSSSQDVGGRITQFGLRLTW